jgi:osmoprotectant transport system ATP-binding protein
MIQFVGVSKKYAEAEALNHLTVDIPAGKTTAVIGASGSGKSTLLRIVAGLIEPSEGTVLFNGMHYTKTNEIEIKRQIGYMIQEGGLFPHLTAGENVAFMAKHLRWSKEQIQERLDQLCQLTAFPHEKLDKYPLELSGGQQQRVSLMRALMLDPKVLLLDEPLAALDPLVRHSLQTDLKAIFETLQKTVLLVTHDMGEAAYFGDNIIFMMNGQIIQQGTLHEITQSPKDPVVIEFLNIQRRVNV